VDGRYNNNKLKACLRGKLREDEFGKEERKNKLTSTTRSVQDCTTGEGGVNVKGPTGREEFGREGLSWYECWRG
jgi:hypothetical protein